MGLDPADERPSGLRVLCVPGSAYDFEEAPLLRLRGACAPTARGETQTRQARAASELHGGAHCYARQPDAR